MSECSTRSDRHCRDVSCAVYGDVCCATSRSVLVLQVVELVFEFVELAMQLVCVRPQL